VHGARFTALALNKALGFQRSQHLMHSSRRNPEVALQVSLGWSSSIKLSIVVDEGKVLALLGCVPGFGFHRHPSRVFTRTPGSSRLQGSGLFFVKLDGPVQIVQHLTRYLASIDDSGHDRMGDSQLQRAIVVFLEEFPCRALMELVDQVDEFTAT
jgi:hypothetical protein